MLRKSISTPSARWPFWPWPWGQVSSPPTRITTPHEALVAAGTFSSGDREGFAAFADLR